MALWRMLGWFWGGKAQNAAENSAAVELAPVKKLKSDVPTTSTTHSPAPETKSPKPPAECSPQGHRSPTEVLDKDVICVGMEDYGGANSPSKDSAGSPLKTQVTDEMIRGTMLGGNRDLLDISRSRVNRFGMDLNFRSIRFSRSSLVYSTQIYKQREHKRVGRARHDAWRRYGALMKIHQLGGWSLEVSSASTNANVGPTKSFTRVEPNTKVAVSPPNFPPIMTEEELLKRPLITGSSTSSHHSRRRRIQGQNNRQELTPSSSGKNFPLEL